MRNDNIGTYDLAFTDCDGLEAGCTDEDEEFDGRSVATGTGTVDIVVPGVALAAVELSSTTSVSVIESKELIPIDPITLTWLLCAEVFEDFADAWLGAELVESGDAGAGGVVGRGTSGEGVVSVDMNGNVGRGARLEILVCKLAKFNVGTR